MDQATHDHVVHPSGFPLAADALTLESGPQVIQSIQGNGMDDAPFYLKNVLRRVRVRLAEWAIRSREVRRVELRHGFLRGERTKATNRVIDGSPLPLDMQQEWGQRVSAHTFRGLQKPEDGRLTEPVSARAPEGLASACAYCAVLSP
jgi:hypothetical protein